jgi:hypothetical protein
MNYKFIISLIGISFFGGTTNAYMVKSNVSQAYISHLTDMGKDQLNYHEFQKALADFQKQGYVVEPSQGEFWSEDVQQITQDKTHVRNWFDFAVEINFQDKEVVRDGVRFRVSPVLKALGRAQEVCAPGLKHCAPADEVEFTGYQIQWNERPDLGGGTSSAGTR